MSLMVDVADVRDAAFRLTPTPSAVFDLDASGIRCVEVNDALTSLTGLTETVLNGDSCASAASLFQSVQAAVDSGSENHIEVQSSTTSEIILLRVAAQSFSTRNSPKTYAVAHFVPVTEQEHQEHRLRSRIRELKDLVDRSTALMYVKDLEGRYVIVNSYFAGMFNRPADSIVGLTDHDLFPADCADVYRSNDKQVLDSGASVEVEEPFGQIGGARDPDDDRRWLSIKFPLIDESGRIYALGAISTDITDRKRAQSAAMAAQLEAERANRSKSEFLSRMSHELRTPLNAILGFAQLLSSDSALTEAPAEYHEGLDQIITAGNHLLALVDDALDLTWIESGAPGFSMDPIPATTALQDALDIIRPIALEQDIDVASDLHNALHKFIRADRRRLRQVFLNLLSNAVKFNRAGGAVRVSCERKNDQLVFLFTDTGDGIPSSDFHALFRPFSRLENAIGTQGTGLGLALSRRLIEEMGGTLELRHSAPGEGTTFSVRLPLIHSGHRSYTSEEGTEHLSLSVPTSARILHIEDTPANVLLVERILGRMGFTHIHTETTGARGIQACNRLNPDLLLLDLNLSDMPGVHVVRRLKENPATALIPIVVLSADATPERMKSLRSMGIRDYVTKPIDVGHFGRAISEALST